MLGEEAETSVGGAQSEGGRSSEHPSLTVVKMTIFFYFDTSVLQQTSTLFCFICLNLF